MGRFIDRSNNNGPDRLADAGVSHLYAKATEGTGFKDSTYASRRYQALRHGVVFGAYHFAALGNPEAEADFFLAFIQGGPKPGQFRPCLDLERGTVVTDRVWAERFVLRCKAKLGYYPAIYGSTSLIAPLRSRSAILRACPWWRAEYGRNDGRLYPLQGGAMGAAAHQYTSVAVFPGVSGRTDASVLLSPTAMLVPHPKKPRRRRISKAAWAYASWWLGIGKYEGHGRFAHRHGVRGAKAPTPHKPRGWKRALRWYRRERAK